MQSLHREWQTAKAQSEKLWKQANPKTAYPVKFDLDLGSWLDKLQSAVRGLDRKKIYVSVDRMPSKLQNAAIAYNASKQNKNKDFRQQLQQYADQALAILAEYEHRVFPYSRALGPASVVVTSEIERLKDKVAEIMVEHDVGAKSWVVGADEERAELDRRYDY